MPHPYWGFCPTQTPMTNDSRQVLSMIVLGESKAEAENHRVDQ